MIEYIIDGLIYTATIPAVLFPALFAARSKWRLNLVSRSQMQLAGAMAVVMVLVTATTLFGNDYPGRDVIRFLAYGFLVTSLWRQVFTLLRVQNDQRSDEIKRERDRVLDGN